MSHLLASALTDVVAVRDENMKLQIALREVIEASDRHDKARRDSAITSARELISDDSDEEVGVKLNWLRCKS